jgi:hypothetical protein
MARKSSHTDFRPSLIDVYSREIIQADENSVYVALSYVWGPCGPPELVATGDSRGRRLPDTVWQTIEDAMEVVKKLSLKYLWVDSCCIDQSNEMEKAVQVRHMDVIYEEAYLTILALSGTSSAAGLPGVSKPFQRIWQPKWTMGSKSYTATTFPSVIRQAERSSWNSRGWTMQEAALSKRCLCFYDEGMSLICREEMQHDLLESTHIKLSYSFGKFPYFLDYKDPQWSSATFYSAVRSFTERKLSYQTDRLMAFTGILNQISRLTGAQFVYGHPKHKFIHSLLWIHGGLNLIQPRIGAGLPTWSWTGWVGEVNFALWLEDLSPQKTPPSPSERQIYRLEIYDSVDDDQHFVQEPDIATVVRWPNQDEGHLAVRVSSEIVKLEVSQIDDPDEDPEEKQEGDRWCILDENRELITHESDSLYHYGGISSSFRVDSQVSKELKDAVRVNFLMLVHWMEKNQYGGKLEEERHGMDSIFALLILYDGHGSVRRVAVVNIPAIKWFEASPRREVVDLV